MKSTATLQVIDVNLWLMDFSLKMLGMNVHRVVSVIRLQSGKLIIHSTAPFTPAEVAQVQALGEPAWILDALVRHDTFAMQGTQAFPSARYLVPAGFPPVARVVTKPLLPFPAEWSEEIDIQSLDGAPEFGEIALLHRPSRTLIVGDLIFNFDQEEGFFKKAMLHLATVNGHYHPGISKPFKGAIKDPAAFSASVAKILTWDFDRIIVGHGHLLPTGGKEKLREAMTSSGVLISS